jgi:hypothetical protein
MDDQQQFDVVKVRDSTLKELERLLEQRRQLDKTISGLRIAINAFNNTIQTQRNQCKPRNQYELDAMPLDPEYTGIREVGLTDAIRKVLEHAPAGMTPKDVRTKLQDLEYKKFPAQNPLAAIHGIFTRLEKAGEIEPTQPDHKAYRWIPPIERIAGSTPLDAIEIFNPEATAERYRSRYEREDRLAPRYKVKPRRPRLKD